MQGVIERTQISSAVYTQGSEELTGFLTNFIMYAEGLMRDVANCWFVILALGPVASGIISFFFILFMSCFAGVLIWWTLFCVFVVLVVASVFFAWQAGYLDDVIAEMTSSNTTDLALINQTLDVVDVAESATSYLEQYMPFGETDEDAAESLQVLWAIAFWTTSFLSLLYVCVVCALTSQIKLAIELIKEAGRTVRKMKTLLLYPFFTYFWVFVLFVYFVGISLFIMSSTADVDTVTGLGADLVSTATDSFTGNNSVSVRGFVTLLEDSSTIVKDFSATNSSETATIDTLENDTFVQVMFVYHLFGYLWTVEFIKAIGMITIAGAQTF
jgi:choline transporter-like protein 2/4/5